MSNVAPWLNATYSPSYAGMDDFDLSFNATASPSSISYKILDDSVCIPLLVLGSLSASLSMIGSSCVIYMSRRQLERCMQRLVFALSLADMVSSSTSLVMPFLIPSYIGFPGAIGTHASCAAIGFIFALGVMIGSSCNAYLSIYYFLVVRRNWKERDFTRGIEIGAYSFAIIVPLSIQIAAAATQSINPSPIINNVCVYSASPWGCNDHEEIECERSTEVIVGALGILATSFIFCFSFIGFLCTFLVWLTVRTTLKRSNRYRFEGGRDSAADERLRQVALQAVLYSLVYLNTLVWPSVGLYIGGLLGSEEIQERKVEPRSVALQYLYWILYPLQGFLNFFVYTRQKINRLRQLEPGQSFFWYYRKVLSPDIAASSRVDASRNRRRP
ncbi:expressed unknown protein [Seminavis robusta]|uniref:G-protein coupled receptors family 1 profile domain-containing protein n=1 Tax=Seminavis robusta TaxID=568900 RepID=A0A9N8DBK2_9STRA|nr:expressed unknown protein [Seminavis robusta]|eukprot:Sro73_g040410.1 n/a (386) ;mRNA; r:82304-83671